MRKKRICLLFGGKSGEHEVSLNSAASVLSALDTSKYEVLPVAISKEGRWLSPGGSLEYLESGADKKFVRGFGEKDKDLDVQKALVVSPETQPVDVVFPLMHGPYGEDGTLQGFLELVGVPFVGSDTLASALAMDKLMAKKIFYAEGIPTPKYWHVERDNYSNILKNVGISFPCVVKPMNLGSSVGIAIVKKREDFQEALDDALKADRKGEVLVEEFVKGKEITVPVLGEEALPVILIAPKEEGAWFDYEVKYNPDLVDEIVPAPISDEITKAAQELALRTHKALKCRHISRTDMIIKEGTDQLTVLEVNTMPGMTSASLFPKAAEAAGISFPELLDRLIEMSLQTRG